VALADDGTVWAATLDGLSRGRDGEWTTFTTHDGLAGDAVTSVAVADDGTVWAGTHDGLSRFQNDSWTSYVGRGSLPGGQG
jgi:ligand-binding sensor domain-containing protein